MEARVTGRAQDVSQGLVAQDVQGFKLLILSGPSPHWCCPPVTLQAELGLGNWAAVSEKKIPNHLLLPSIIFGIDAS